MRCASGLLCTFRKANERLSSDLASLTAEFKLEKERQGNKVTAASILAHSGDVR